MGNEEDWKKLQQWQEKKEAEQQLDLERRRVPSKGLKEQQKAEKPDNMIRAAKAVHTTKDVGNTLLQLSNEVKLLIVVCIACFVMILIHAGNVPNANKTLESRYAEDFEVVSVVEKDHGAKFYTYEYKNPKFYFHVLTYGKNCVSEDVKQCWFRTFYEKWDSPLKDKVEIDIQETEDGLIEKYEVRSMFKNFAEMDEAIETLFQVREEIANRGGPAYESMVVRGENGITPQVYHLFDDMEAFKKEAKRQYVSMAIVNGTPDDTITEEDLKLYCRPDSMKLYINGKPVMGNGMFTRRTISNKSKLQ